MKTLTDFRKTVETGVDPRLDQDHFNTTTHTHPAAISVFFCLLHFGTLKGMIKKLTLHELSKIFVESMHCMLLGYSFKPRPYSHAVGTKGSVMTIVL